MRQPRYAATVRLVGALMLTSLLTCAHAAELGDAVITSHVGQPLVADIELTALADPAQAVTARLASADVYRGANISMSPVLASMNLSVMRRDGRQFLHITSVKAVEAEYIHLFLDLGEGAKHNIRAATLWLTPDPSPAPAPVAKPVLPAPAAAAVPAAPLPRRAAPATPACVQQFTAEQIKACSATDYKNGLLSAQIVELEEKVKALQLAVDRRSAEPPAASSASASASAPTPVKPVTAPLLVPKAKPAAVPEAGFPWLLVSGLVVLLAAIGGGAFFFLSRKKSKSVETAAADSVAWYAKLAARFKRKPKALLLPEEGAAAE